MNATLFLVDGANVGRFSTLNGAPRKGSGKGKGKGPPIDPGKVWLAMRTIRNQFPGSEVTLFLYETVISDWQQRKLPELQQILAGDKDCITKVPSRSDVDEFLLQEAMRGALNGNAVRIITNDNFDEYVAGPRAIAGLTKEKLQKMLCKYTFSRSCFVIQPGSRATPARAQPPPPQPCADKNAKWEAGLRAWTRAPAPSSSSKGPGVATIPPPEQKRGIKRNREADAGGKGQASHAANGGGKFIYDTSHPDFVKPPSWDATDELLGRVPNTQPMRKKRR